MIVALIGGIALGFSDSDFTKVVFVILMFACWNIATRMLLPRRILTGSPSGYVVYRYYHTTNNTLTEYTWLRYLLRTLVMTASVSGIAFLVARLYKLHW